MDIKNEKRFNGKADAYKKYRPSYPKELIDYLYSQAGFKQESTIADIGSGTGIFSRLLLERGSKVYCIEPNEDMRRIAENDLSEFSKFISVGASAENTGLPENSVDFITAATAFHWFDRQRFALECVRALKHGGKVALVSNAADNSSEIIVKNLSIRKKYAVETKSLERTGEIAEFFPNGICETVIFKNDLQFDRESYIGRNLSSSYAPKEEADPERYQEFLREIGNLFDEHSVNGILLYPHFTKCYIGIL